MVRLITLDRPQVALAASHRNSSLHHVGYNNLQSQLDNQTQSPYLPPDSALSSSSTSSSKSAIAFAPEKSV